MTTHPKQNDSNGLAVTSLILGILSVTGAGVLTGIPALITGIISLRNPVNKGMGIAGIVMGGISVVLTILFVALILVLLFAGVFAVSTSDLPLDLDNSSPQEPSLERRI